VKRYEENQPSIPTSSSPIQNLKSKIGSVIPWATVFWVFFRRHLFCPNDVYLLAGDEVVITKAGKKTYGLDRFFSSLISKPISGLSFFTLSLVSVQQRHSFPIQIEQVIKSDV